jgi:hypothetical protein
MKVERDCGTCSGVGEVPDGKGGGWKTCGTCKGTGIVVEET